MFIQKINTKYYKACTYKYKNHKARNSSKYNLEENKLNIPIQ